GLTVDAVGSDGTRRESIRALAAGGTALWLGMHEQDATMPAFDLVVREQRVQGSFAYTNPEFGYALGLLESGLIDPVVARQAAPAAQQLPAGEATLGRDDLRVGDAPDLHDVVVVLVEQLAERNVERVGERPHGVDRGVPVPAFESRERRLRHA